MKKLVFVFAVLVFCACGSKKKTEAGNGSLEKRLAEFMKLNDEMNMEKMMDYIYPKLFTIAPRESVMKAMKDGFDSEEVKVELDSLKVDKIYPVFEMDKGSYAKVNYSMIMFMDLKKPKDSIDKPVTDHSIGKEYPAPTATLMQSIMENEFGKENVSVDSQTGSIKVYAKSPMIAVKDEYAKEWSFINFKKDNEMFAKLFSKEVLDKLATYK